MAPTSATRRPESLHPRGAHAPHPVIACCNRGRCPGVTSATVPPRRRREGRRDLPVLRPGRRRRPRPHPGTRAERAPTTTTTSRRSRRHLWLLVAALGRLPRYRPCRASSRSSATELTPTSKRSERREGVRLHCRRGSGRVRAVAQLGQRVGLGPRSRFKSRHAEQRALSPKCEESRCLPVIPGGMSTDHPGTTKPRPKPGPGVLTEGGNPFATRNLAVDPESSDSAPPQRVTPGVLPSLGRLLTAARRAIQIPSSVGLAPDFGTPSMNRD